MNSEEPSIFSHLNEIRTSALPEGGLTNVIFCGKMRNESDTSDVLAVHRQIVEEEVSKEKSNVTGLLMTQGVAILHFLEGPNTSIQRILMQLSEHSHFEVPSIYNRVNFDPNARDATVPIQQGRVVYNIEDRPSRIYPEWYSCTIQERKSGTEDVNSENAKDVVFDLSVKLLEIGKRLSVETAENLDLSKHAENLPGKNLILAFTICDSFCTLPEFVENYIGPYHVEIESEQTWPLEPLVRYF